MITVMGRLFSAVLFAIDRIFRTNHNSQLSILNSQLSILNCQFPKA